MVGQMHHIGQKNKAIKQGYAKKRGKDDSMPKMFNDIGGDREDSRVHEMSNTSDSDGMSRVWSKSDCND